MNLTWRPARQIWQQRPREIEVYSDDEVLCLAALVLTARDAGGVRGAQGEIVDQRRPDRARRLPGASQAQGHRRRRRPRSTKPFDGVALDVRLGHVQRLDRCRRVIHREWNRQAEGSGKQLLEVKGGADVDVVIGEESRLLGELPEI